MNQIAEDQDIQNHICANSDNKCSPIDLNICTRCATNYYIFIGD
jgi:hypothetical protein